MLYSLLLGKSNSHTHHYVLYNIPHYLVPLIRSLRNRVGTKPDHSGHLTSLRPPWAMFPLPEVVEQGVPKKFHAGGDGNGGDVDDDGDDGDGGGDDESHSK